MIEGDFDYGLLYPDTDNLLGVFALAQAQYSNELEKAQTGNFVDLSIFDLDTLREQAAEGKFLMSIEELEALILLEYGRDQDVDLLAARHYLFLQGSGADAIFYFGKKETGVYFAKYPLQDTIHRDFQQPSTMSFEHCNITGEILGEG